MQGALLSVLIFWMLTTPHEFAHAWVAKKLGDDTPVIQGRVTLNPLAHVDWLGTVILPLLVSLSGGGFIGWGKPVNTNPLKLRWGLKGMALVAMAGPASNVIFAILLLAVAAHSGNAVNTLCSGSARLSPRKLIGIIAMWGEHVVLRLGAVEPVSCHLQHASGPATGRIQAPPGGARTAFHIQ